ncbi:cell wall metabolism sensor histidine kinase WalK [Vagococcus lutrae]|uniref:histidine kinase n=1 Tax=Vagococcus lutrae TaxID=81947 RepID=A0AAE9XGV8_9ENTE|nr:cell wall metabolism sensor histidine kinase WalK [Vagococcus lutrae]MDO5742020.1 cell wall metabolism sensor histidine kinase WalK [Vagococcus sp.]UQF11078.1 cell wall metabolism sensor histidine kinase WalK [Vagococcus lutrae]UQF22698.1 cell wall metabolism sensor histidine kinase WalK [Vagococcus lutrae]UQF38036.1 cell wall metabolism sensor histidine kinase WalK [Vagococcus lutrae]UQF63382.1 cell wall metabolism sensor histidine kinase WalK [Vagococcus lutrae]
MKKKFNFFQSVHFKIAMVFVLLLVISVEIIGAIFIRELENTTINTFQINMNSQVEQLASNLSNELTSDTDDPDDLNLKRIISEFAKNDILEVRVVDDKGIVRATSEVTKQSDVGKKNDYNSLNDFSEKRTEITDPNTGERVYINVQQVKSTTGNAVIGAVYVKSNIEKKYKEISETTLIFFTASVIAMTISLGVAILVARTITKPIGEMQRQAVRIASGDYTGKVEVHGQDELGQLGHTFNELSDRVKEAQETLEAERHRLDSVLSHMTDGVVATDRRGKVIIINEMAQLLLNETVESAIGQSILHVLRIEENYTLRQLLEEQNEQLIEIPGEEEDDWTILRVDFAMIRRESGFISGLVCVLHDVTEQQKVESERREFVSNVSHELRTPLTSMRSYLEALSDGAWQDQDIAPKFISVSLEETDRMIRMISDLLELSRMDSQKMNLQLEMVNLNEMFNFVLDRFEMMITSKNQDYTIRREFTRRTIWVEVDSDKMIQVLDNILNNALKYSPDGGVITCSLLETHNNVIMSVSDQGMGIPKKDVKRVFDRFFRVDKARSRAMGGSGLGLAISKEVIQGHGGTIWAESEENAGSTFFISLPYIPVEEDLWE